MMNQSEPLTNCSALSNATKASIEAFHKRLQHLYPCVDDVTKLPQCWSPESKAPPLGLTNDNLGCYFRGNLSQDDDEKFAGAVRTDHYIPRSCILYYFEIRFISKGREGFMGVGLTSAQVALTKLPGWTRGSYGYHADDGNVFKEGGSGEKFGPTFTTGDVIGCGYNMLDGTCFFTKNGLYLGLAFAGLPRNIMLYPTVGLKTSGEEIRANFGQEDFVYDIAEDLKYLKRTITGYVTVCPIINFGNWQSTLHQLVQSWLIQNSYPKTADAFTKLARLEFKENPHRIQQRSEIQQLVLRGRISEAIRLTNRLCPNLLQNNPNLLFVLKCRQFIELISGAENDYQLSNFDSSSNGHLNIELNGDQPGPLNNLAMSTTTMKNGRDEMVRSEECSRNDNLRTGSSSSLQELMDVDQPTISPSVSTNTSNNHRSSSVLITNNNHYPIHQTPNQSKSDHTNGNIDRLSSDTDFELDNDEQRFAKLLQFGRELSDFLQQLTKLYGKNDINEKMLQDTISLIAYTNPENSSIGKLLDPKEREPVSQLLNSSIVKAEMGDSYRSPLEDVVTHIKKLIRLNDCHGKWIVDRLY